MRQRKKDCIVAMFCLYEREEEKRSGKDEERRIVLLISMKNVILIRKLQFIFMTFHMVNHSKGEKEERPLEVYLLPFVMEDAICV